jgi:hypothetical protein
MPVLLLVLALAKRELISKAPLRIGQNAKLRCQSILSLPQYVSLTLKAVCYRIEVPLHSTQSSNSIL